MSPFVYAPLVLVISAYKNSLASYVDANYLLKWLSYLSDEWGVYVCFTVYVTCLLKTKKLLVLTQAVF
jgi:hypothetical protein